MTIEELEACLAMAMRHCRQRGVLAVEHDDVYYYWEVASPDWMQFGETVPEPVVGSLSDDEEELRKMLVDPVRVSSLDLERIAHLLLRLSDQLAF